MKILAIETSNKTLSVALVEDERLLAEITTTVQKNHSTTLMPAVERLFVATKLDPAAIDRFAVAQGPGSYTGLRIGVTTAKTLASTLKKELVGLSSLKILAGNVNRSPYLICPLFDARRENIFTGLYRFEEGHLTTIMSDRHQDLSSWLDELAEFQEPIIFVGSDVTLFWSKITQRLAKAARLALPLENIPRASVLATLAREESPDAEIDDFVPQYLRLTEAEVNWQAAHPQEKPINYVEKI